VAAIPRWKINAVRISAACLAGIVLGTFVFFSDDPYPALAHALHLRTAATRVELGTNVGLVIEADPSLIPIVAQRLAEHGDRASFVFGAGWSAQTFHALHGSNDEAVLALHSDSSLEWIHARSELTKEA
jgi:hypothetical protein